MSRDLDVLVIGEINPDIIVSGVSSPVAFGQAEVEVEGIGLAVGSSSVITAAGLARLGLRTALVGIVGDDLFGRYMLDAIRDLGIDASGCIVDPGVSTGASVVLVAPDRDRAILTDARAMSRLTADRVPADLLDRARHVHVGSYYLQPGLQPGVPGLFAAARRRGATTSVDGNWDPTGRWDGGIDAVLRASDTILLNAAEATALAGAHDHGEPEATMRAIAGRAARPDGPAPLVVVKLGAAGAIAMRDGAPIRVPASPAAVVDTIGAGDSFDAGVICAILAGWPDVRAVELGVRCGTLSTRAAGGTAAQSTLAEAMADRP